ncbi:MAG: hypothetical protein KGJ51_07740, partial [Acidobacteriota bacterium]|nr:hypothetical protein [Acidobacteriota bacterium]
FDKDDAKIIVPLILVVLGLWLTPINKLALLGGAGAYYLLYFFLRQSLVALGRFFATVRHWLFFRCPHCKSRELILQGYQGYHSDELYGYHLCNRCKETSVEVNNKLIKATQRRELL